MELANILNKDHPLPGTAIPGRLGYRRMTHEEYMAFPALNASLMKCRTPAEMHAYLLAPQRQTDAFAMGSLVHIAALEPEERWGNRFAIADIPINKTFGKPYGRDSQKGKDAWETAVALNPGKIVATVEEHEEYIAEVKKLQKALVADDDAMSELADADFEVSGILWHPRWLCWVKWRVDILPRRRHPEHKGHYLVDLKSSSRHPSDFEKDCFQFGYWYQSAWYSHCDELLRAKIVGPGAPAVASFDFIVVSKEDTAKARPVMCQAITTPCIDELNPGYQTARRALGIPEGTGRPDIFLTSLREHIASNPAPDDFFALRRIWPDEINTTGKRRIIPGSTAT